MYLYHVSVARLVFILLISLFPPHRIAGAGEPPQPMHVIAFYTAKEDPAHISFVHEANRWFRAAAERYGFTYDSTSHWDRMNESSLRNYQVVIFLDSRPEAEAQRTVFREYMEHGGAWMGFHFAAFALTPSDVPQDWDWYHNEFLGCGQYAGNTWRPTKAVLRVETHGHPVTRKLPETFTAAPNEWYKWEKNLRLNPEILILASVDTASFPLGTGPKPHEIWHSGDYPVVWTNNRYRMVYFNMGHNDIDYEHGTNRELSATFSSEWQNRMVVEALRWLGRSR